ncbi:MAG: hypothetical protein IPP02_12145 [Chitinophagaceae bacterium]|nr:hypothetical protein [Chitinophagaceae bacterium]MBK7678509.1 hypothetical protein [Chitinophagaceae bacterium]MBK9464183.1 hypothetical protein [Chitinophagaceae bacterium]MBK9658695.1 hypothetical protein [Chitinophagaceae bacterium]MBK9939118.1 hypothetical protein [Chitinophagaceae bacterium]
MTSTNRYLILFLFLIVSTVTNAQGVSVADTIKIPHNYKPKFERQLRHEAIDKEQKAILGSDGKADNLFAPSKDNEVNFVITQSLVKKVDAIQYLIETDKDFDHRLKVWYLSGMENVLKYFRQNWKLRSDRKINPSNLPSIITAYEESVKKDRNGESIENIVSALPYDAGMNIVNATIFDKNIGFIPANQNLVLKYCLLYPEKTLSTLNINPGMPFADSLVRVVSKIYPRQLYDYAQSSNKLGAVIRNIQDDDFIKTVVKMARSKDGQQYFPFLDNIIRGKLTLEEIDAAKNDSLLYYRLLVKTQIEYSERAINKDTVFEYKTLRDRLERKAKENFVNIINGLHNENAEFRFRSIQPLTPQELFYLAVSTDGSMYTSSFVKGVYPLMMKKINNRGDSLLMSLRFDKYRKFIKMAAGFNMLSNFLNTFPPQKDAGDESDAEKLMKAFVGKLEQGNGLEDGVDVADSYASIVETIKPLANQMLKNIQDNYQRNEKTGIKRGMAIYNILNKLFLSADSSSKIDLTKELGIPPVYEVPFKALANDSGRVIIQVFIYGDKDGIGVFPGILNLFGNANWKTDRSNPQWITISSLKGKPVSIYLNRPLPEETNEDAKAQEALCKFLKDNKLYPTVTINRGHSYNAPYTIEQMFSTSKIVFMGSCGGYRSIHDILEKAPDAHIVGTKQIADAPVNNPFLKLLGEKLREGSGIEWIPFWKELGKMATDKIFEDYVPPYKNLGALFIKAYKIAMEE